MNSMFTLVKVYAVFLNSQIVAATSAGTFFESVGGRTIPSEGVPFDIGADRKSAPDL